MALQTIDITKSATENATILNGNFTEIDGKTSSLEGRIDEIEENQPTSGSNITVGDTVENLVGIDVDMIEIDLSSSNFSWATDKKLNGSLTAVNAEGFAYNNAKGGVHLLKDDILLTNADSDSPLLLSSSDKWACGSSRIKIADGRNKFDGKYIAYKATSECYITFSYKTNVDYNVHVFVVRCDVVEVPLMFSAGQLNGSYGYANVESYHNPFWSPGRHEVITDHIVLTGMQGRYLFIPEGLTTWGTLYTRYNALPADVTVSESQSDVKSFVSRTYWGADKKYLIIPIRDSEEIYRFMMQLSYIGTARAYIVTRDWLIKHGYADQWAGKKWVMLGDSYVAGHNIGTVNTWYNRFAFEHFVNYTSMGVNGIGLVRSPNINHGILAELEDRLLDNGEPLDFDVIGVCCGRNDSTTSVPIGTIDDMIELPDGTNQYLHGDVTFMGGLNYLCDWLLDNYAGKRIFFITPWNFLNNAGGTAATPIEYVDAMKTIAGKWGIPCFDAARDSGISVQHEGFREKYFLSTSDVSHLNIAGHKFMSHGPVCKWLENLFVD